MAMRKTLTIDGKKVNFAVNGFTPIEYSMEFGSDYFADLYEVEKGNVSSQSFYQIVYLMAKTADKNIPQMDEWYKSFDSFPIFEVYEQLSPLILKNMRTSKPAKKNRKIPNR